MAQEDTVLSNVALNDYRDIIDELPMEMQRNFALIRQLDERVEGMMNKVAESSMALCKSKKNIPEKERRQRLVAIGNLLEDALKRGEEKFALAKSMYDSVDRHCTRVDNDLQKFEDEQLIGPSRMGRTPSNTSAATVEEVVEPPGRKRKKKKATHPSPVKEGSYLSAEESKQNAEAAISQSDLRIDPNEPVYCYCRQVSFGDMIACDNEDCEIEWFHNECVGLTSPPKGKWYCKNCILLIKNKKKL
ncbi:hypothetical protein BC940DRAFT_292725 [Gongronella butleri]|nr:hypothetical protein BC940DRAFT_292725 [Gongronella butleri]